MTSEETKQMVKSYYGKFAETGGALESCCSVMKLPGSGCAVDEGLYTLDEIFMVPVGALGLSRGCGNPGSFANIQPGAVVVDFGCGGGIDVILAAHQAGTQGRVVGIDFTPQMIDQAKQAVAEAGLQDRNIELLVANMEKTGLPSNFADVVISNCAINLCPDKNAVYEEAFRILKPGGRLAVSDIVLTTDFAPEVQERLRSTWTGCIGGAIAEEDYWQTVRQAGFDNVQIVASHTLTPGELEAMACSPGKEFAPAPAEEDIAMAQGKVSSVQFTAVKTLLNQETK